MSVAGIHQPDPRSPGETRWLHAAWELRFALLVVPIALLPLAIMLWIGGMSLWRASDQPILGSTALTSMILLAVIHVLYQQRARLEQAHEALARLASTDPLTGLGNRRELWRALELAQSKGSPSIVLLVFDLNNFKLINDTRGHAEGDRVLIAFAGALRAGTRAGVDALFRTGGDEFVALLFDIQPAESEAVARRVLCLLGEALASRAPEAPCSASVGLAAKEPGEAADAWLHRADAAMYRAKSQQLPLCVAPGGAAVGVERRRAARSADPEDPDMGG